MWLGLGGSVGAEGGVHWGRIEVLLGSPGSGWGAAVAVAGGRLGAAGGASGVWLGVSWGADECAWEFLGPRWD